MKHKKMYTKKENIFKRYLKRTLWNKTMALLFIGIGMGSAWLSNGDVTFLVFTLICGISMFFARTDLREL